MHVLEALVSVFAPHICVGCSAEAGKLVCDACQDDLAPITSRCYHCETVTANYAVCSECSPHSYLSQVAVFTRYQGVAKELMHHMKYERARAGIAQIADFMAECAVTFPADALLVPIPTASSRIRGRGYDHARVLAHELSVRTRLPYRSLLGRVGQAHQMGAPRQERLKQLQGAFRPLHLEQIRGRHIVLVDDVLTTGASLELAAQVFMSAGAAQVDAWVFARA